MATTVFIHTNFGANNLAATVQNASASVKPLIIRLKSATQGGADEDFQLPYNPVQVRYGAMSDEIAQIPRPATTPIIAFKAHRLLTVDMTFVLAFPGDGLSRSVDTEIATLRRFAANGNRVVQLINFDALTNTAFQYRNMSTERDTSGLFFSIVEMGVESVRRNKENQISQASVTLSLIENRNPRINPTFIPPLRPVAPAKTCKDPIYKKNNPTKCKNKPKPKSTVPSATSASNASADAILDTEKAKCYFDVNNKQICPP